MEEFEAAAGEMQQEFMDACEGGMDPMQAFDSLSLLAWKVEWVLWDLMGYASSGRYGAWDMPPGDMGGMFDDAPPPPPPEGDMPLLHQEWREWTLMEMDNRLLLHQRGYASSWDGSGF